MNFARQAASLSEVGLHGIRPWKSPRRNASAASFSAALPYASASSGVTRQRLILILETVDEILGREIAGGIAGVLEQVADRIVVLAVGQAP